MWFTLIGIRWWPQVRWGEPPSLAVLTHSIPDCQQPALSPMGMGDSSWVIRPCPLLSRRQTDGTRHYQLCGQNTLLHILTKLLKPQLCSKNLSASTCDGPLAVFFTKCSTPSPPFTCFLLWDARSLRWATVVPGGYMQLWRRSRRHSFYVITHWGHKGPSKEPSLTKDSVPHPGVQGDAPLPPSFTTPLGRSKSTENEHFFPAIKSSG